MAELIPYGIVERVITRLASLAFQEIGEVYGVKSEIEKLKDTVELIRAVLLDADQKQEQNHVVKIWIRRLKQVIHNADDLFDAVLVEEMRHKVHGEGNKVRKVRGFFSSSNHIIFRLKMSHKIKKIQQQFIDVKEGVSNLNLSQRVVVIRHGEIGGRETSSSVLESNIVGRDESKKEIINFLLHTHTNQNVSLVALVGIGGLGKTALAQLVYNDTEVKKFFQKQMWVCVSQDFDVKTLVKKILESSTTDAVHDQQLEVLKNKLQEVIKGQKFLLVLDDTWNENPEKWNLLQTFLMCGAQGSKVLVTTRSQTVAKTMNASTSYVLQGLTKEQSWTLLKNLAFEKNEIVSENLVLIGEKIGEKCGGIPLAIKSIGGLLQSKRKEIEWLNILHGKFWKLCEEDDSIMPVLKLSYDYLPTELRQCFVYCSLYPKNYKIYKDELIQLWIAQGYLECSNERQGLEDTGDEYVQILLMRSLFQDLERNKNGDIICFKMHDLMHDLAQSIAGTDCYMHCEGDVIAGKPMHISFESNGIPLLNLIDVNKVRTILWPGMQNWKLVMDRQVKKLSTVSNLKHLRVLDLSKSSLIELPKSIGELKHLRYLDLSHCDQLTSLPKTISNLVNLQTLKLEACGRLEFSIKVITKLINLRHLMIDSCKAFQGMMPAGIGTLTSLQFLSTFRVGQDDGKKKSAKLNELKELNSLRHELCIKNLDRVRDVKGEASDVNLKEKKYLWSLDLSWENGKDNENGDSLQLLERLHPHQNLKQLSLDYYPGMRISSWLSSLTNLVQITFYGCSNCQGLPPLERIPSLKYLTINRMDALEYIDYEEIPPTTNMFFPSLEDLTIYKCPNLKGWHRIMGDFNNVTNTIENPQSLPLPPFPCLSSLTIQHCANLTSMPTFPHLVKGLVLVACSVKLLIETTCLAQSSSSFTPLSALKYMRINDIHIEALPEDWMQNLVSLEKLDVVEVPSLWHVQHLPNAAALQELLIRDMDNLDCQFLHCPPCLQTITISHCHNLKDFPEWICSLPSLQLLHIHYCPNLESLPEAMPRLTNLYTLEILGCPLLDEKCKRETGADWPKIAHIPHITVNDKTI